MSDAWIFVVSEVSCIFHVLEPGGDFPDVLVLDDLRAAVPVILILNMSTQAPYLTHPR